MDQQYRAVFFDLGGTLRIALQDEPYLRHARRKLAEIAGTELPYEAVTGQTDVIDQILASSGITQESDEKAETSEQTKTDENGDGDAVEDLATEKQVTRRWLLPVGIDMACAVSLMLVRKRSFRS